MRASEAMSVCGLTAAGGPNSGQVARHRHLFFGGDNWPKEQMANRHRTISQSASETPDAHEVHSDGHIT